MYVAYSQEKNDRSYNLQQESQGTNLLWCYRRGDDFNANCGARTDIREEDIREEAIDRKDFFSSLFLLLLIFQKFERMK